MLKIRLQRVGRKHEPTFRVVLTDSKNSTKSGKIHEILGSYDPRKKTEVFQGDRIKEWMGKGAKLSGTLHNLLISHKIIDGKKVNVLPKKSPIKKEEAKTEGSAEVPAVKEEVAPEQETKAESIKSTEPVEAKADEPVEEVVEEVKEEPVAEVPAEEPVPEVAKE